MNHYWVVQVLLQRIIMLLKKKIIQPLVVNITEVRQNGRKCSHFRERMYQIRVLIHPFFMLLSLLCCVLWCITKHIHGKTRALIIKVEHVSYYPLNDIISFGKDKGKVLIEFPLKLNIKKGAKCCQSV